MATPSRTPSPRHPRCCARWSPTRATCCGYVRSRANGRSSSASPTSRTPSSWHRHASAGCSPSDEPDIVGYDQALWVDRLGHNEDDPERPAGPVRGAPQREPRPVASDARDGARPLRDASRTGPRGRGPHGAHGRGSPSDPPGAGATRARDAQVPLTTSSSRGASLSTSAPSGAHTTMSSMRTP